MNDTATLTPSAPQWELTEDKIETLARAGIIPKGTPAAQVEVFANICRTHQLDPFAKEIYLVGYGGKYSPIVGINGYRAKAESSGVHAGTDAAKYDMKPDGSYLTAQALIKAGKKPTTATVTVWKVMGGIRVPFTHEAVFSEFAGSGKWNQMPFQMIAKVAEAHAIRKAFPRMVTGLHIAEEVDAIKSEANVPTSPKGTLERGSDTWEKAVAYLASGEKGAMKKVTTKYALTEADRVALLDAATAYNLAQPAPNNAD